MTKLFFWNNWHNGDIIFERPLVRRILDRQDVQITWGCWRNHKVLIQDLPVTVIAHAKDDREPAGDLLPMCPPDHLPIYLWVGQYPDTRHTCWRNVVEVYNRQVKGHGLDLAISCGDVPMVDFPYAPVAIRNNAVYVENGMVRAMQSKFEFDMRRLSSEFPDLNFYCTADPRCQAPNLFNCGRLNLVQLSAVSNKCEALIGKGSGTFACAMTEMNRFKPQALMNFHSFDGATFWEYPGCPTQYLETYEQLREFLQEVRRRPVINLTQPEAVFATAPIAPQQPGAGGGFLDMVAAQITRAAVQYQQDPGNLAIVRSLVQGRRKLAEALLNLPDAELEQAYRLEPGKAHQQLIAINFKINEYEGIGEEGVREAEQAFVQGVRDRLARGWDQPKALQLFLAASLYDYAHELPRHFDLPRLPAWFVADYVAIMLTPPPLFRAVGEADRYLQFMREWTAYLVGGVMSNASMPIWQQAAAVFLQRANFIPLYFNEQDIKDIFSRRADLMEHALKQFGHVTDHAPIDVAQNGRPIRVGIIKAVYNPSAETFASLPLYEHLGGDFEVTLYCFQSIDHPIEHYCRSKAKALKVLPNDLAAQVAFLRAERLAILFFASNVAAVTNQMSLLASHRLARVQATSIFSIVTTGFRHMDFYVSGTLTDPAPTAQDHYRERLLRMDGSVHCFAYPPSPPSPMRLERARAQIDPAATVFASGANLYKLLPELLHTWARIMEQVPGSILLLLPYGPHWTSNYPKTAFVSLVTGICAEHGVNADRLRILDQTPAPERNDLKEILRIADVYLDSFPFCGSTSLIEPLEVGLPIVVRAGEQLRGSMAAAMLHELGIPELIASDEAAYIDLATNLGQDAALRSTFSERVRAGMARKPRFVDSESYARRIGPIFKEMLTQAEKSR